MYHDIVISSVAHNAVTLMLPKITYFVSIIIISIGNHTHSSPIWK